MRFIIGNGDWNLQQSKVLPLFSNVLLRSLSLVSVTVWPQFQCKGFWKLNSTPFPIRKARVDIEGRKLTKSNSRPPQSFSTSLHTIGLSCTTAVTQFGFQQRRVSLSPPICVFPSSTKSVCKTDWSVVSDFYRLSNYLYHFNTNWWVIAKREDTNTRATLVHDACHHLTRKYLSTHMHTPTRTYPTTRVAKSPPQIENIMCGRRAPISPLWWWSC